MLPMLFYSLITPNFGTVGLRFGHVSKVGQGLGARYRIFALGVKTGA